MLFADAPIDLSCHRRCETGQRWTLTALPLFVWMGEILFAPSSPTTCSTACALDGNLPGRLIHVNVIGCGIFAAISGSPPPPPPPSGDVLPELKRRNYDEPSASARSCLRHAQTLIPPSIIMIVYGVSVNVSIAHCSGRRPAGHHNDSSVHGLHHDLGTEQGENAAAQPPCLSGEVKRLHSSANSPLIIAVIGSIYTGVATATSAHARGGGIAPRCSSPAA